MEELDAVHLYAAGSLFSIALTQAQVHRQTSIPSQDLTFEEDGDFDLTPSQEAGVAWSSEACGLLRHVLTYLKIDPQAWTGIEITSTLPNAKDHIAPLIRILQEDDGALSESASSTSRSTPNSVSAKAVAVLANAVDAMALSLEDSSPRPLSAQSKTSQASSSAETARRSISSPSSNSAKRWASMKKPLLDKRSDSENHSKAPVNGPSKSEERCYPPQQRTLIKQRKVAVLYELLTACVADTPEEKAGKSVLRAGYDARQRVAFRLLALWLDLEWQKVGAIELMVAYTAMAAEKEFRDSHPEDGGKSTTAKKWIRGTIIGAAAITGGALLAVTGGLAAPAIAAGLTAIAPAIIGAGGLATVVGSAAGSVAVAASFGAAGAGLAGTKMARRTGGVDEFLFLPIGDNHQQGRLAVAIVVSGIVLEAESDFTRPWEYLPDMDMEWYALRYESKELLAVSTAIEDWLASSAARELIKAGAMMTVLAGLVAALAWPATLLAATDWIDSKWTIAVDRSDKAGKILAKCLLAGSQGNRPVTLMGFSLGARVIFSCLEYLATKQGENDAGSIVERVILLGAPITLDQKRWKTVRKVVAGRFINAYSTNDWILGVIYRASFLTQGLAGLQNVEIPGIENIDISDIVNGHSMYLTKTNEILQALDLNSFYPIYPSKIYSATEQATD